MATEKELKKYEKFGKKYIYISLNNEIYPNDDVSRKFLLATKQELKQLNKLTNNRIKLFDKKYCPKGWAGYE